MTSTDGAARFYADYLLPLKRSNDRRDVHYFSAGPDRTKDSYWESPTSRSSGIRVLDRDGCKGTALLDQLGAYWTERNQSQLTKLLPALEEIRKALSGNGSAGEDSPAPLTDFVYPLH